MSWVRLSFSQSISMKTRNVIDVLAAAFALLIVFGAIRCNRMFAVDSCLDMGGRWNSEARECEGQRDVR